MSNFCPEWVFASCCAKTAHDFLYTNNGITIIAKKFSNELSTKYDEIKFEEISDVSEKMLQFLSEINASEDAINLVGSNSYIENLKIYNSQSDAIDIDFGSGQIINSLFKNIGNDGKDLSGTESFLKNLEFVNISDKIISVGENSNVQILNLKGTNSFVGVASKDGSKTIVQEVEFNGVNIPFASYIKKLSYEAANLDVKKISTLKTFEALGLKDENSEIFIDGESKGNIEEDILNIIYKRLPIKKDDRRI